MPEQITACADCRGMAANLLPVLGHTDCVKAIRAEQQAARRFWIRINPQGCVEGSALGEYVGPNVEDAHKQFTPRARDRKRETTEGYRHELIGHAEWKQRAEPCLLGQCEHRKRAAS
ncbi:MAG: hypothetical protein HOY79_01035 [Streptomyces sp.]|nr:hypothetical protein [Streptomyces sp.]